MRRAARAALLCLAALLVGCVEDEARGGGAQPAATGAVLAVDGVAIHPAQVDRVAALFGELHPSFVERHRRRLALTQVLLPRAAVAARFPAEREEARRRAEEARAALARGEELEPETRSGHWESLGVEIWDRLRRGAGWSEPFEDPGRFLLVRRISEERRGPRVGQVLYTFEMLSFPYLDRPGGTRNIEEIVDTSHLTVLDPAWGELVPEAWRHRMRGPDR